MKHCLSILLIAIALLLRNNAVAQEDVITKATAFPSRMIDQIQRKINTVENGLTRNTEKYLQRWLRREEKMRRKLERTNPELAKRLFTTSLDSLQNSLNKLGQPAQAMATTAGNYIPSIDSLGTMLSFLQQNQLIKNNSPATVQKTFSQLQQLKGRLQQSANIQQYLKERKAILLQQLKNMPGFGKYLQKINEDVYYYGQVVKEWKATLSDPKVLERKALQLLQQWPAFNDFMARNSELARLFPNMGNNNGISATTLIAGLQTRSQLNNLFQTRLSTGGPSAQQQLQDQVSNAMSQLNQLKNGNFGNGSSAADMPNFQPKAMKHKRFISRLEPGFNIQFNKNSQYFPTTADIGLQLRYAVNKHTGIGVGAAYKAGLGNDWKDIRLTHNGVGLRSFADWRIKGNLWLNAGAEWNYATGFANVRQLRNFNNWQTSALAGISKKFNAGKKMKGSILLLYDFLADQRIPASQPFIYRITYSLK